MAEGLDPLELKIVVNKDTGKLEVFGVELEKIAKKGKETQTNMGKLGGEFTNLLGPVAALGTVAGVFHFFMEGAKAAEAQAESLRRLSFTLQMNGVSWEENEEKIKKWASTIQATTRFSDDQYLSAFERAAKVTKDVAQAHEMVRIAMGMSVKAGGTVEDRIGQITSLMSGNAKEVRGLAREMGTLINQSDSVGVTLDKLQGKYSGLAEGEKSATAEAMKLKHEYEDIQKQAGTWFMEAIVGWKDYFVFVGKGFETLLAQSKIVMTFVGGILNPFKSNASLKADLHKGFEDVKDIWRAHQEDLEKIKKKVKLDPNAGKQEEQELRKNLSDRLQIIQSMESAELALKNKSESQKKEVILRSWSSQLALVEKNKNAFAGKDKELAALRSKITVDSAAKLKAIEQKNVQERIGIQEAWVAKNRQAGAAIGDAGRKAADTLASSYGSAFAKMAMEGKFSEEALLAASKQIAEGVIADIIRIGIQKTIAEAIALGSKEAETAAVLQLDAALKQATVSAWALNAAMIGG